MTSNSSNRKSILVIDDEVYLVEMIKDMLEASHSIEVSNSVNEALEILKRFKPDIIFCDFMMPEKTGIDFYNVLKNEGLGLEKKIIFLSGGVFTQEGKEFFERIQNRMLEKPFREVDLLQMIEEATRISQSNEEIDS